MNPASVNSLNSERLQYSFYEYMEQSLSLYKLFTVFRRVILDVDMLGHFKDRSLPS